MQSIALETCKTIRSAHPYQVLATIIVSRESLFKFRQSFGVIFHWHITYPLYAVVSSAYPYELLKLYCRRHFLWLGQRTTMTPTIEHYTDRIAKSNFIFVSGEGGFQTKLCWTSCYSNIIEQLQLFLHQNHEKAILAGLDPDITTFISEDIKKIVDGGLFKKWMEFFLPIQQRNA